MKLKRLRAVNLFRYENLDLIFPQDGIDKIIAVLGLNNDSNGSDSNGSGKSSVFEIISWIGFGKLLRKSFSSDVIRRGQKKGHGILEFDNHMGQAICIERGRSVKATGFDLKLTVDGIPEKNKKIIQEKIYEYLGFFDHANAFDDFRNTVLLSRATIDMFASSKTGPTARLALIKRFIGIDIITDAVEIVRKKRNNLENKLTASKINIANLQVNLAELGSKESIQETINKCGIDISANEEITATVGKNIDSTKEELVIVDECKALKNKVEHFDYRLKTINEDMKSDARILEDKKKKLADIDVEGILEKAEQSAVLIKEYDDEIITRRKALEEVNNKCIEMRVKINGIVIPDKKTPLVCPECANDLLLKGSILKKYDIVEAENIIKERKEEKIKLEAELTVLDTEYKKANSAVVAIDWTCGKTKEEKQGFRAEITNANFITEAIVDVEKRIATKTEEYENISKQITLANEQFTEKLKNLNTDNIDAFSSELQTKRDSLEGRRNELLVLITQLKSELDSAKSSLTMFANYNKRIEDSKSSLKGVEDEYGKCTFYLTAFPEIARRIIEQVRPFFEGRVNYYLGLLDVVERVKFDTLVPKRSQKEELSTGFDINVWDGETWGNFDLYSDGEKTRIALAISFGLRDLVTESRNVPQYFFLCDEIADSLDETGMQNFFNMLKQISGDKYIISHKPPDTLQHLSDRVLLIQRRGNVSSAGFK